VRIAGLPVQLNVCVPLPNFRVADLLSLTPGRVVLSEWPSSDDVPLACGHVHLVWTEFEVVDQALAVRVTRLG
jgi:flagellar motor switch protein FliN/FliY